MQKILAQFFEVSIRAVALLIFGVVLGPSSLSAQTEQQIIRGTVNVVVANSHGMVVLTDSTGTLTDSSGKVTSQEVQKLIRFDDHSVCAIAGFGSGQVSAGLQFNVDVVGIVSDFRDQLAAKQGSLSFHDRLATLSFLIQMYIQGYANMGEVLFPGKLTDEQLYFSLLLAGNDTDGKPRIGSLELNARPVTLANGKTSWQFTTDTSVLDVRNDLEWRVRGMWDVGDKIMKKPRPYAASPAVQRYLRSAANRGSALQPGDLEALAKFIAAETSKKYPDIVGGPDQFAVLQNGQFTKFQQQDFPLPPKPMLVLLIMDAHFQFGAGGDIVGPKGAATIWIRDTIVGQQELVLDGNFFLGNEIRDAVVRYNGGRTVFDSSNKVVNSTLWTGPPMGPNADFVRYLVTSFNWTRCMPFPCDAIR